MDGTTQPMRYGAREAAGGPERLDRRRKAAMIVQLLLSEGLKIPLASLPEESQLCLLRELATLRLVDRETIEAVAAEFTRDLKAVGLAAPGGVDAALDAYGDQISPATAARLRAEVAAARPAEPWVQLAALDPSELVPLMMQEATEVCAVALSKLPVPKAAALLGLLPGERARRITYAVSLTSGITPQAVATIGQTLAATYASRPIPAFGTAPVQRVGAILNSSPVSTRDDMLSSLDNEDPDFAQKVRKAIFTFEDIPLRIAPLDLPRLLREFDNTALITALGFVGLDHKVTQFMLDNISVRMADQLRGECEDRGKVRKSDGEAAQAEIVGVIRDLVDKGELTYVQPEEEEGK